MLDDWPMRCRRRFVPLPDRYESQSKLLVRYVVDTSVIDQGDSKLPLVQY